ncbi:MAG: nitrite reductase [Vibrio sp.]
MLVTVVIFCVVIALIWITHFKTCSDQPIRNPLILSAVFIALSGLIYAQLGSTDALLAEKVESVSTTNMNQPKALIQSAEHQNKDQIKKMQARVLEDKQNGENWYALGNAYMYANEFESAATAFLYAEKLVKSPQANIYAARATALYYGHNQRMDAETQSLVQQALEIDKDNVPTLMLVASNHFLNAEYQDAIDAWQQALDSGHADADRVAIIKAINQAKELNHQ